MGDQPQQCKLKRNFGWSPVPAKQHYSVLSNWTNVIELIRHKVFLDCQSTITMDTSHRYYMLNYIFAGNLLVSIILLCLANLRLKQLYEVRPWVFQQHIRNNDLV